MPKRGIRGINSENGVKIVLANTSQILILRRFVKEVRENVIPSVPRLGL